MAATRDEQPCPAVSAHIARATVQRAAPAGRRTACALTYTGTHLQNRSRGVYHETLRHFRHDEAPDAKLCARVRAKLGHVIPNVHGIQVTAHNGVVSLSGKLSDEEIDRVLRALRSVPGVNDVENHLHSGNGVHA